MLYSLDCCMGLFTCFGLASALLDASSNAKIGPSRPFANVLNAVLQLLQ